MQLLGLWGARPRLQAARRRLPALPWRPLGAGAIETEAVRRRVDLQIARIEVGTLAKSLRPHAGDPLHQPAGSRRHRQDAHASAATGERSASAASRSSSRSRSSTSARSASRRPKDLPAGGQPADREGRATSAREARDAYRRYRCDLRHRGPLSARGPAAAQDHLGRDAASLQRDADRRVCAADGGTPAHRRASIAAIEARRDFWLAAIGPARRRRGGGVAAAMSSEATKQWPRRAALAAINTTGD